MRLLSQLKALSAADRWLLVQVVITICVVRVGLFAFSAQTLNRILSKRDLSPRTNGESQLFARKIARFVSKVSSYVPRATCLTQALATTHLLRKFGHPASLRIGVAKTSTQELQAHAWVEADNEVVIGVVPDLTRYTVLLPVNRDIA